MDAERRRLAGIRENLERRARVVQFIRNFFAEGGFLEVETPSRMREIAPEQHIVPLTSDGWFLSTSPELHMKRLLAAGYERIFQFSRCFRRGEQGRWHNPEFTLLEWYRAGADYLQMLSEAERMIIYVAEKLGLGGTMRYQNMQISLAEPWRRVTVRDAFLAAAGWDPVQKDDAGRFDIDLIDKVIPSFGGEPVILTEYPASMASLALLNRHNPLVSERGELFVGGLEVANAFSELTDSREQEARFSREIVVINQTGRNAEMPTRFLNALSQMPPSGGIALGVDRLVMLLCNASSIEDVLPFPADFI